MWNCKKISAFLITKQINKIIKSSGTTLTQENAAQELLNWGIVILGDNDHPNGLVFTFTQELIPTDNTSVYLKTNPSPKNLIQVGGPVKFFKKQ